MVNTSEQQDIFKNGYEGKFYITCLCHTYLQDPKNDLRLSIFSKSKTGVSRFKKSMDFKESIGSPRKNELTKTSEI